MAVVGPNFVESGFDGGYDMDSVAGAEGGGLGQGPRHEFHLTKDAICNWDQMPSLIRYIVQEKIGHFCGGFSFEGTFAHFAVQCASQFSNAK